MKNTIKVFVSAILLSVLFVACSDNSATTENTEEETVATTVSETEATTVENATIVWTGKNVVGKTHTGNLSFQESALDFEGTTLKGGSFVVDMASLTNADVEGEYNQKLVGHLKSADFFDVETYPVSTFNITSVEPTENEGEYNVTGDLTIKATTLPQSFVAKVDVVDGQATVSTNFSFDRAKYDVRYNSGSFFDDLGDKAIEDEINLDIKIVSPIGE